MPGHTGVGGTWRMIMGFPGNLGGLAVSIVMPVGDPAYQLQVDPRPTSEADGDERGTKRWYRQAKETKCGEKGGKKSERLVVPLNQGNHPRDPGEGRGRRLMNRWRETCRVRRDPITCTRNDNGSRNSPGIALIWPSRTWRITSTSNGCSQPMHGHARTELSAWTDKPRKNTRLTWSPTSRTSSTAPNPARTWRRPCVACTSPRRARPPRLAPWGSPRLRIKSSSARC